MSLVKMNKRGYLITIITVLLLMSLLVLASSYATRLKTNEEIYVKSILGDKIRYIENDIGEEFFYFWTLETDSIQIKQSKIDIDFEDLFNATANITFPYYSGNYTTFVEDYYGKKMNTEIELNNFTDGFMIHPYGQQFYFDQAGNFYISIHPDYVNHSKWYEIRFEVLNWEKSEQTIDVDPADDGCSTWNKVQVQVDTPGAGGNVYNDQPCLDPYEANEPFEIVFEHNTGAGTYEMRLKIYYGFYDGKPGTFKIVRDDPAAFRVTLGNGTKVPKPLHFTFREFTEELIPVDGKDVYITTKDKSKINVVIDDLEKEGRMVLARQQS